MNARLPKVNVSGNAIVAGIVTFVLCTLLLYGVFSVTAGIWGSGPRMPFIGVLAIRGLDVVAVLIWALVNAVVILTPVFLITAALRLFGVQHAIYAGLSAGAILLGIGLIRFPESAVQILWPGALFCFPGAIAASFSFRHGTSVLDSRV